MNQLLLHFYCRVCDCTSIESVIAIPRIIGASTITAVASELALGESNETTVPKELPKLMSRSEEFGFMVLWGM